MFEIYLARHGQNQDNANGILNGHRDLPLTDKGVIQAEELAEQILESGLHFDRIFTSPLIRAYHTAKIIAAHGLGPDPEVMVNLIERDFGVMAGIDQSRVRELCAPDVLEAGVVTYFLCAQGAETFPDLLARAKVVLAWLSSTIQEGRILLVGHGDLGKMLYAAYYGLTWEQGLTDLHFGNSELLILSPNSSSEVTHLVRIDQHNT